ncbi:outer membrane protein assembly factor BamB family protein [Bythopirellula polymerisocia]|uniref:Outer membrane protein assembly factor BamB n=1 Tax=Bythopirellula polymerisocia TaxID=2528003 RepID=A0A5C6CEU4_9BACT|nr:PQQ-binding-like beta-propeller repeat protein [Bythopirellula polymerisocia]TWU22788.1 Outer membrane protein assembly factor BamB precursor [Bythopirellula polymerisocia]
MSNHNRRTFVVTSLSGLSLSLLTGFKRLTRTAAEFARPQASLNGSDFSFIHFSDTHINPRTPGQLQNEDSRSVETLEWLARCSSEPVVQKPYSITTGMPAFAIHTGDVMEYGPVGYAWQDFEKAIASMACPVSLVPGNHDNTWGEINHLLRKTYGDDSYSFDFGGCHFICINSSGLLDPLPSLDRRTLDWVAADLAAVPDSTPLLIAMHHPLSGDAGYASEYDKIRLWKLLVGRRVALIMDGHWHTVHCQQWQGIDRVNGGATFGIHTGYNTVTLKDGILRVMFRYEKESDERPQLVPLLEKPLKDLASLADFPLRVPTETDTGGQLRVHVPKSPHSVSMRVWIDSDIENAQYLREASDFHIFALDTEKICRGWHFVSARVRESGKRAVTTAERFKLLPGQDASYQVYETNVGAGVKTRPLVNEDLISLANTSGRVFGLSRSLEKKWTYDTESQVVHSLSEIGERILVGDIAGKVHCLNSADGKKTWKASLPNPLYAAAAIHGALAIFADGAGWLHAINHKDGQIQWSSQLTNYGFESKPLLVEGQLIAGCWDGFIYSVDCDSGRTLWKTWSPKGHQDVKSRYYGAADSPIVACGGSLFACDRGWVLGRFTLNGEFQEVIQENITSITASNVDQSLYAKSLNNYLTRLDSACTPIWEVEVPTGRVPNQPVEFDGRVAILSDTGILTILDSDSGQQLFQYSISPRLYCLSGIGTDSKSAIVSADMDGTVTSLERKDVLEPVHS